jgi:O-antigen/teichoic acid export membrane protein
VYAACQWIVFVLLVKSLPLAEVGHFAFAVALTGPVYVLANVRLRNLLASGVSSPDGFQDYLEARLVTTVSACGVSLAAGLVASTAIDAFAIVTLMALAKACDSVSDICHGLFQRELKMRNAAIGLMTNGILSVVAVAVSLAVSSSVAIATAGYAVASLIALVVWDLPRTRLSSPGIDATLSIANARRRFGAVPGLLRQAMPLGLSAAIGSVQANLPRYFVAAYLGPAALAIFTALSYIPTMGNLVVNATAQAVLPVLAKDLRSSRSRFELRLRALVVAGATLGIVSVVSIALFGRTMLGWIYSHEYARHGAVLLWLMIAAAVSYTYVFLGTATTARMRFGAQFCISVAGCTVVACLVGPLVGRFGLVGGAWALLAGAIVEGGAYLTLTLHDLKGDGRARAAVRSVLVEGVRS